MELVRAFTTRQPVAVGTAGTTLQRNITIYVLVAGIAGGLLLILAILFLCKYCSRLRSRSSGGNIASAIISSKNAVWGVGQNHSHLAASNPVGDVNHSKEPPESQLLRDNSGASYNSGRATEVSVALTNTGVGKVQHRLTTGSNNNKSTTSSTTVGPNSAAVTTLSPSVNPSGPLSLSALHQHGTMDTASPSILKDDISDSYVIQVEPIRVMAVSPSSILGGADSWASDESSTAHRMTINAEVDSWTRRMQQQQTTTDNSGGSGDEVHDSPVSAPAGNRRSLRHAASHPSSYDDGSSASSAVSKRRLDWRNSHRNYRSAPTTAASRDSYALNYETRRALRDYHQHSIEASSVYQTTVANRRMLPKRGGSMRETVLASSQDASSTSSITIAELTNSGNCIPPTTVSVAQQHSRCQMMASPATKRWRCHTVDCPCSNNVTASSAVNKDLMLDGALTAHRHSFPSSGELASPSSSSANRRHYHHQRSEDPQSHFGGRTKEAFYDGYLNRSESLDWADFQARTKKTSITRDEVASVIDDDVDGTAGQLQSASAGPAPRITIRYNDPGSLESVNEDNLFFCLEAGSKNEFRQRLEKTIHAQYRQVWELRANLEEHSEFYEPSSPEPEAIPNPGLVISDLESFDSNPESLPGEEDEDLARHTYPSPSPQDLSSACEMKTPSSNMLLPVASSGSWKRQSYRSIAMNSRLRRQNGPTGIPLQQSPQQPQSSFDSIDTIETSSTEASRMDHVTTSFESSATDSTNGPEVTIQPSVSHRMLALRNDSGYRSLESAVVPAPRLTKTLATALSLSEDDMNDQRTEASSTMTEPQCQCRSQVLHDEKCERYKPIVFARCTRYGMKTRSSSTSTSHPSVHPATGWRHQQRIQQHQSQQFLTRDYSIDERTDAIFREFSRCDPVYDASGSKNVGGSQGELRPTGFSHRSRWINQHQRHDTQHHYQHRFLSFQDASSPHPLASDTSDSLLQHCSLKE